MSDERSRESSAYSTALDGAVSHLRAVKTHVMHLPKGVLRRHSQADGARAKEVNTSPDHDLPAAIGNEVPGLCERPQQSRARQDPKLRDRPAPSTGIPIARA